MEKTFLPTASLLGLLPFIASVQAGEDYTFSSGKAVTDPAPVAEALYTDKLTGDWGGLRTDLANRGINLDLRLSQYYQGVASGGVNENWEYGGTLDYRVHLDADKLIGAKGLMIDLHARTRYGRDISADAGAFVLPNTGMLSQAPGGYNGTDITGLSVTQMLPLPGDRAGLVMFGLLDVVDLVTMFFPSVDYGQSGFQNLNGTVTALPWFGAVRGLSLYGALAATVHPKYQLAQTGVMVTGTQNESTSWGSLSDAVDEGVWIAGFHRFFWEMDEKMGYFMVFGAGSTRAQPSNEPNDIVVIPGQGLTTTEENPWDIALYLYQDIWQSSADPRRKANVMIGGTIGPDDPQFAQWHVFANAEASGLLDSRPNDRMGVSGWVNGLSSGFKDLTSPVVDLQNTWGFEMYYNYQLTPWAHVTADLQLVQNERADDDFAIIPGVRMVIDF